jgi:outer membrane protein OmpA-like peptidoglycan-associated protein
MKTLITGFLIFACWSSLATWIYVCKIRGLCNETEYIVVNAPAVSEELSNDSLSVIPVLIPVAPEMHMVYFEFDKSSFIIDSMLTSFSDSSITYMNHSQESGLLITGHTDAVGSVDYNQALGYRRAQSIKDFFESKGIVPEKIATDSKGEQEPVENNSTDEGRAKNRRVSVIINK